MKALVLGSTGAVGRHIVESLIDNHEIQEIHVFVRRQVTYTSLKMKRFMSVQATLKLNFIKSRFGEGIGQDPYDFAYSSEVMYGV